jgi:hypothetical protein
MTVYLSGKITGDKHFKKKFLKAKVKLVKNGYDVINPCDISCYADFLSYEQFLHIDYALIDCCDCIYMLKDWKDSNGARLELNYAKCKGKEILYEEN